MKKNKLIGISLLVMVAVFVGGAYLYKKKNSEEQRLTLEKNRKILSRDHSPVFGNPEAPVEIVEFLDPECETCGNFYPLVKNIMHQFPGKIKLVIRYAPFHQDSIFAVKILEAARNQNKYWETLAKLFEKQPEWGDHHNPNPMLIWTYLPGLGLNTDQIKRDMEDSEITNRINIDIADLNTFSVKKTPTFFVNGQPLETFGYEQLFEAVKKEVEKSMKNK